MIQSQINRMDKPEDEIDLLPLFTGVWKYFRRLWWLALALIVIGAVGVNLVQRVFYHPMYECSATFTITTGNGESGSYGFYYDTSTANQISLTFPYILESSFFQNTLLEELGSDTLNGMVTAETIASSNVVTMCVTSDNPKDAYSILEAALTIYPETARYVLGNIRFNMLDEPETPTKPYNQMSLQKSLIYGGGGGLLLSALIFLMMSCLRKTVCTPDDMKQVTSLRCLAVFPHVRFKARKQNDDTSISLLNPKLPFGYKESVRLLEKRIEKNFDRSSGNVLMVTSSVPREGKSTIAANLACALAAEGRQVLLVDGDLRKQRDAAHLGMCGEYGLEDITSSEPQEAARLLNKSRESGVFLIGSGKSVKGPVQVLSSRNVRRFIDYMREKMDYVIIDSPPCTMFQDASLLAEYADGILYVVKYDYVPHQKIQEGIAFLGGQKTPFIGYIFNDFSERSGEYSYGRYGYGRYGYGKYGYGTYGHRKYGSNEYEKSDEKEED